MQRKLTYLKGYLKLLVNESWKPKWVGLGCAMASLG